MANQEQLDILRQGIEKWNSWRTQHKQISIDLSSANLIYANLNRADLINANLSGTNLNGANFIYANLNGARLISTNLYEANLSGANLNRADLSEATLNRADLIEANLSRANLSEATVEATTFGNVDLSSAKGLETIRHRGPSTIGIDTIYKSQGKIPVVFLRGAGVDESFIEYVHSLTSKPIEYYTCFISYSSKDELFARRLHNDLQQEGVRCWFAPEDMEIGDKIKSRIDESIRIYDKLLLILSEHSIKSSWVAYEVEQALMKEPQGIPNVLYPVSVDQSILTCTTDWAKNIKDTRHVGNFETWANPEKYEANFQRLLRALNTRKGQQ